MKKNLFFLAALGAIALTSCTNDEFVGDNSPNAIQESTDGAIMFGLNVPNMTRSGEFVGATAAEKLGGMFVVEGTKGTEATDAPSSTVVFDNYLVGYEYDHAGKTESDTHNWEYVGKESGITGSTIGSAVAGNRMTGATWSALHSTVTAQTIKYWDYSTSQYDFIAWSTGTCEAIATGDASSGHVKVTRINTGTTLASDGFTLTAASAEDLLQCYYTDINTVLKANYGKPVTLTFKNMAAKVRVALYETVPGYSVQDVEFYQDEATALTVDITANEATLYTPTGAENQLPQSGTVLVYYPRIGSGNNTAADYNKASVTVTPGATKSPTQTFGTLSGTIGTTLPTATFAGLAKDDYYTAVIPNTDGKALTLRVNYTLVSTDGSNEEIKVYGAKAVVPPTYTKWLPNYAYTYIFKISDNTNGWTDTDATAQGLLPITFDAVVTSFVDANAEQTTVTTVATPSITTYQQGHNTGENGAFTVPDEYDNDGKNLYVKVMDNSTATPSPVTTLSADNSLLFKITKSAADYVASEAEVMDALQNRTNDPTGDPKASYKNASPVGRNGITLTKDATHISNTATQIVNGVDNQPITVSSGEVAEITLSALGAGTYAYVYCTAPTSEEKIYHVAAGVTDAASAAPYYDVDPSDIVAETSDDDKAKAGKVYFVKNVDETGAFVSWTFVQTKVGVSSVAGLFEADIPADKATSYTAGHFYFDVYYQNNGEYAVKVFKVVD